MSDESGDKTRKLFIIKDQDGGEMYLYEWIPGEASKPDTYDTIISLLKKQDRLEKKNLEKAKRERRNTKDSEHTLLFLLRSLIVRDQMDDNEEERRTILETNLGSSDDALLGTWHEVRKTDLWHGTFKICKFSLRV